MKTKGFIFFLVFALMVLFGAQSALAQRGSETTGGTPLDPLVDPSAKGFHVKGTIIIVYQNIVEDAACEAFGSLAATMYPLFRVGKGYARQAFTDSAQKVCYFDADTQIKIIEDFISDHVIHATFCLPGSPCPRRYWKLKSIESYYDLQGPDLQSVDLYSGVLLADVVIVVR